METLTINIDEGHTTEHTVEEVLKLIKEGYTSGIDPTWDLVKEDRE